MREYEIREWVDGYVPIIVYAESEEEAWKRYENKDYAEVGEWESVGEITGLDIEDLGEV